MLGGHYPARLHPSLADAYDLLLDPLRAAEPGRVITMSSGGMYTSGLTVSNLQMDEKSYSGAQQYARAKRAQVVLNEMWAARVPRSEIVGPSAPPSPVWL